MCFFWFLLPPMIQAFEEAEATLPAPMLLVLGVTQFLSHLAGLVLAIVLAAIAVCVAFEMACRSEAKPLIRLTVGGALALVLAVVALWFSLVSVTTLRQVERQQHAAPPWLQAPAPDDAPPPGGA